MNVMVLLNKIIRKIILLSRTKYIFRFITNKYPSTTIDTSINALSSTAEEYYRPPDSSIICNNVVLTPSKDLRIIIPAYNAGLYLYDCLNSILSQRTNYDYEIIVVDDGSTDDTYNIATNLAKKDSRVKVIHQANAGIASARNIALRNINSSYLMFVDSDDILNDNALDSLLNIAYQKNADIVEGEYCYLKEGEKIRVPFPQQKSFKHKIYGFPWGKVYKSNLFINIQFPDDYWYEDTIISQVIYPLCTIFESVNQTVYQYRIDNNLSITHTQVGNRKALDSLYISELCLKTRNKLGQAIGNEECLNLFLEQIQINYIRTMFLPKNIKKYIFLYTIELLHKYFAHLPPIIDGEFSPLYKALMKKDYNRYKFFCYFNSI